MISGVLMKAIRKMRAGAGAEVVEVAVPKPRTHEVLVKVVATSICGTDVHIYNWDPWAAGRIKPPMIFGHEFAGEVVEVGPQVEHIAVGDRISAETHIPCRGCLQCRTGQMHLCRNVKILGVDRDGCFADYVVVPEICCIKNDATLPWAIASLQEPFGNATYAVSASQVAGKSVVIFGDGPIGIFASAVAHAYGATTLIVVGMQPYRLNIMRGFKPDHIIDVTKEDARARIMDITGGGGVDVVLEMSGSPKAIHDGLHVVRRGGTFTAFGIPARPVEIDFAEELIFKGINLIAISGRMMFGTWVEVANLLNSKRIDISPVITHEFPLEKIDAAMELLNAKDIKAGKIILKP